MSDNEPRDPRPRPSTSSSMLIRDRYTRFIRDHDIAWELTIAAFAAAYVVISFAEDSATGAIAGQLALAEAVLTVIFILEFSTRFIASRDRRDYLRGHWVDLIALIPTFGEVRLLRLVRLLRAIRMSAGIYRALSSRRSATTG